jgi:Asp-tRNA(Asn)/Glu-tRNA(Gln) amidotransferase A subunit family amidase
MTTLPSATIRALFKKGKRLTSYVDWIAPAYLITLVGFPAGSVPAGKASNGLPVGFQIVAPRLGEPRILGLAKLIQRANPDRMAAIQLTFGTGMSRASCRKY